MKVEIRDAILLLESEITQLVFNKIKEDPESGRKIDVAWKIFSMYMLIILFMLAASGAFAQIEVKQFNAGWNSANDVKWIQSLSDCKTISYTDISKDKSPQKE